MKTEKLMAEEHSQLQFKKQYLQSCFNLYLPEIKKFHVIDCNEKHTQEANILENELHWEKTHRQEEATCLIFSLVNNQSSLINDVLEKSINAKYVLLDVEIGTKKTDLLANLESHGFRILFERLNITYLTNFKKQFKLLEKNLNLGHEEVIDALGTSIRKVRKLPKDTVVDLVEAEGQDLLKAERFDVAIKAHYGRLWKQKIAESWRDFVFFEQALRITGPSKEIIEHDGSGKSGIDQFKLIFHSLMKKIEISNIPTIPVDKNYLAFDGAHRIAAAIVEKRKVRLAKVDTICSSHPRADFFAGTSHGHKSLSSDILEEAVIEYCRIKSGLVLALIFPSVSLKTFASAALSELGSIVFEKDFICSPKAGAGLLRQAYLGQNWVHKDEKNSGLAYKVKCCFPYLGTVRAVLIDDCDPRNIRSIKEKIRNHYGIGNHSIHITDGDEELLRISRVVFNKNSLDLLQMGVSNLPNFHNKLFVYRDWLERNQLNEELFSVDGSALLALLGLRECRDLDFLYGRDPESLPHLPHKVDCHNSLEKFHNHTISDILGDPRLHCWYMGVKFTSPNLVRDMKASRNELKDRKDVRLLNTRLLLDRPKWLRKMNFYGVVLMSYISSKLHAVIQRVKAPLRPIVNIYRNWKE